MLKIGSKNTSYTIFQGDSLRLVVSCKEIPIFGDEWTGRWGIKDNILSTDTTVDGELAYSEDRKYLIANLDPEKSKTLTEKTYALVIEVENKEDQFRKEILHASLTVKAGGLPPKD